MIFHYSCWTGEVSLFWNNLCMLSRFSNVWLFADPMDCSQPGSSVHGFLQTRILEWGSMSSSRGSSQPRTEPTSPLVQALVGRLFTTEPPEKPIMELWVTVKPAYSFLMLGSEEGNHSYRSQCDHGQGWQQSSAFIVMISEWMSAGVIGHTKKLSFDYWVIPRFVV